MTYNLQRGFSYLKRILEIIALYSLSFVRRDLELNSSDKSKCSVGCTSNLIDKESNIYIPLVTNIDTYRDEFLQKLLRGNFLKEAS